MKNLSCSTVDDMRSTITFQLSIAGDAEDMLGQPAVNIVEVKPPSSIRILYLDRVELELSFVEIQRTALRETARASSTTKRHSQRTTNLRRTHQAPSPARGTRCSPTWFNTRQCNGLHLTFQLLC